MDNNRLGDFEKIRSGWHALQAIKQASNIIAPAMINITEQEALDGGANSWPQFKHTMRGSEYPSNPSSSPIQPNNKNPSIPPQPL